MAQFTSQTGFQFPIPEQQFFRTDDPDNIYRRTASGIEAYAVKQGQNKNLFIPGFTEQQYQALPQFSSGIVTDLARAMGQGTIRVTGTLTPDLISQFGQVTPLGSVTQGALDPQTAALVKAGGAGIGGFAAGGQAGLAAGSALSQTPQALQNRITAMTEERNRLQQLLGSPSAPITGGLLAPAPAPITAFKTPTATSIPNIAGLEAAQITGMLTEPEKKEESLNQRIIELQNRLLGRSAFQQQQEVTAGVPETQQAIDDLNTRLRDLQRQATAGTVQISGQAIPTGTIGTQQQEFLRNNAIEALTVSSLMDAMTNKLTSAQKKVEMAVAAKYDPILEELNVVTANANIIKNSQSYSAAERQRAELVALVKGAQKEQVEAQQAEQGAIWGLAVQAAQNGLTNTPILEKIRTAKSKEQALIIAAPYLAKPTEGTPLPIPAPAIAGLPAGFENLPPKTQEAVIQQNALDAQTVSSAYTTVQGTLSKYNLTPETLTVEGAGKLNDADITALGKAIARMQNPDIARQGGDAGNIFAPTSFVEKVKQAYRAMLTGKQYLPNKVVEAVQNAVALYGGRLGTTIPTMPPVQPSAPAIQAPAISSAGLMIQSTKTPSGLNATITIK